MFHCYYLTTLVYTYIMCVDNMYIIIVFTRDKIVELS